MVADRLTVEVRPGEYAAFAAADLEDGSTALSWLGQAGFAVRSGGRVILIDPYLSDSLAVKYAGKEFPHKRMMASPVAPSALPRVDVVFCTHRHSDHMDPGTLPGIARSHPEARFVVPRAEREAALRMGLDEERLLCADSGDALEPIQGVRAYAVASAHEELKVDAEGRHHFLGYVLETDCGRVYHSGDCVPYAGLAESLSSLHVVIALLPVNGRDAFRRERGVPGNMTFDEAVALCRSARIGCLVPHHFGMFAFNTTDEDDLRRAGASTDNVKVIVPDLKTYLVLRDSRSAAADDERGDNG